MDTEEGFRLAPALVAGARGRLGLIHGTLPGGPPMALALAPIYDRKTSSCPMMLPPFVVRLNNPSSLVRYPSFPVTD